MTALSKAKLAIFKSLLEKKYRNAEGMFIVEGIKMYQEAQSSTFEIIAIIISEEQITKISPFLALNTEYPIYYTPSICFKTLSTHNSPEGIITVLKFPQNEYFAQTLTAIPPQFLNEGPSFLLENIQDPGNVGTILRTADWFGINNIICTEGCADILNPKTLRSSMGAIFRTNVVYIKALSPDILAQVPQLYAATMNGIALRETNFAPNTCIVLGNEAKGVSAIVAAQAQPFTIPGTGGAESLNVGVAAGIIAYEVAMRR